MQISVVVGTYLKMLSFTNREKSDMRFFYETANWNDSEAQWLGRKRLPKCKPLDRLRQLCVTELFCFPGYIEVVQRWTEHWLGTKSHSGNVSDQRSTSILSLASNYMYNTLLHSEHWRINPCILIMLIDFSECLKWIILVLYGIHRWVLLQNAENLDFGADLHS